MDTLLSGINPDKFFESLLIIILAILSPIIGAIVDHKLNKSAQSLAESSTQSAPPKTNRWLTVGWVVTVILVVALLFLVSKDRTAVPNGGDTGAVSQSSSFNLPGDIKEEQGTGSTTSSQVPPTSTTVATPEKTEYLVKLKPLKLSPSHPDIKNDETIEVDSEPRPNSISYLCIQSCGEGNHEAHIIYNLSRDWNRLEMHVGLANETISYDQVATFTFKINGTPVLEETVKKGEPMAHVSLDVSDADSLELVASSNKTGERALLVWVSPTLTK